MRCRILLGRDSWMRFHSRSYQTLPTPDGRVLGEFILVHICNNSGGGTSAYILEVAYHLIYEGTDMSLDTTPRLTPVNLVRRDSSPALTGHCMVDLLPLSDSSETTECFVSSGRRNIPLSGYRELKPGDILGTASSPLLRVLLETLAIQDAPNDNSPAQPDTASITGNTDPPRRNPRRSYWSA